MMDAKSVHWLAGLIEGEGCFQMCSGNRYPQIHLSMTDKDVVERAAKLTNAKSVRERNYVRDGNVGKPVYEITVGGARGAGWMMTLYSLMGERRQTKIRELLDQWKALPAGGPVRGHRYSDNHQCWRGHDRTEENTYTSPDGRLHCKACRAENARKFRENHK